MKIFENIWSGRFESLLSWENFDQYWQTLVEQNTNDWFIYAVGQTLPTMVSSPEETVKFLTQTATLLHKEHQERYCGIVYVDNKAQPKMIKIYDPSNLGVSCGFSENPPLPGWVLSKTQPKMIPAFEQTLIITGKRKRWWQTIFLGKTAS